MKNLKVKDGEKQFKMYTHVHLVKTTYTGRSTEQKAHIRKHALPQEENRIQVGKSRNFKSREYQWSIPWY